MKETKTQNILAHIIVNGIVLLLIIGTILCFFVISYTIGYSNCVRDTLKISLENNLK